MVCLVFCFKHALYFVTSFFIVTFTEPQLCLLGAHFNQFIVFH